MKKMLAAALSLLLAFTAIGCGTTQLSVPGGAQTETEASFTPGEDDYVYNSPAEYLLFLQTVFTTLLPSCQRDTELGLGQYKEIYCADETLRNGREADTLLSTPSSGDNYRFCSTLPVFYGLLQETERYLSAHKINYDTLAQPYGKKHALKRADVQAVTELLLHKETALSFASTAGAAYVEDAGLFVYDELENPYQSMLDKGYTLEFAGSDLGWEAQRPWGERMKSCSVFQFFFYDAATAMLYNPYGEAIGYTHNIDGLRGEGGDLILRYSTFQGSAVEHTQYGVMAFYNNDGGVEKNTPIGAVTCGSFAVSGAGTGALPETELSDQELTRIGSEFFDDYYHDKNAGTKPANYFLSSFYESPQTVDLSPMPTQDPAVWARWCRDYLGISPADVKMDVSQLGTKPCETPYVTFQQGSVSDGKLTLRYYNEMLRQNAVLTLRKNGDSYQFLSNLPG